MLVACVESSGPDPLQAAFFSLGKSRCVYLVALVVKCFLLLVSEAPAVLAGVEFVGLSIHSGVVDMGFFSDLVGSVGGALVGGMFGKDANEDSRAHSEAMAQHGIRWRVADAKAAGLHPLYALGAAGAIPAGNAQPIMTAAEGAAMGQNLARSAVGQTEQERQTHAAQLRAINAAAEKDEALAAAARSEAARAAQAAVQSKPIVPSPEPGLDYWMRGLENSRMFDAANAAADPRPSRSGSVSMKASEQVSRRAGGPHMEASDNPFWQEYEVAPGFRSLLPRSSDPSESLENLSVWNIPAVLEANRQRYGDGWLKRFLREVYGISIPTFEQQMNKNLPPYARSHRLLMDELRRRSPWR